MASQNLYQLKDIGRSFAKGGETVHVLRGLNLDVAEGDGGVAGIVERPEEQEDPDQELDKYRQAENNAAGHAKAQGEGHRMMCWGSARFQRAKSCGFLLSL